ncbi:DUF6838 family protein [Peptococcus simiae]|uniref:DUF6838 family protein n=1 Tax=Peptococcus simiae TaxID=1643805 RepID=A0ABW9GZW5_9FIRM
MLEKLIIAVQESLEEAFGLPIHGKAVEEGLKLPALFVSLLPITTTPFLDKKGMHRLTIAVDYVDDDMTAREMAGVHAKLFKALRYVQDADGHLHRGWDIRQTTTEENVPQMVVSYSVVFDQDKDIEYVERLLQSQYMKKEQTDM